MPTRITINFPTGRDNAFYFRVFCWADDTLYPAINNAKRGTIHDLNRIRETVRINYREEAAHWGCGPIDQENTTQAFSRLRGDR